MKNESGTPRFKKSLKAFIISLTLVLSLIPPISGYATPGDNPPLNSAPVSTIDDVGFLNASNAAIQNNDVLWSGTDYFLNYDFSMIESQADYVVSQNDEGDTVYRVEVPLPTGLKWSDVGADITMLAGSLECGKFKILSDKEAVIEFTGDFWGNEPTSFVGNARTKCQLDMDEIGDSAQNYTVNFADGSSVTFKVGNNQPAEHLLTKAGTYNTTTNRIEWTVTYTPGSQGDLVFPFTLTDTLNANHVYVDGSLKLGGAGITPASVNATGTEFTTTIVSASVGTPLVYTYETALSDEALKNNAGSQIAAENTVVIKDTANTTVKSVPRTVNVTAAQTQFMVKGSEIIGDGRTIKWTITVNTNDRRLDNLILHDALPTGLNLDDSSIEINGNPVSFGDIGSGGTVQGANTSTFTLAMPKTGGEYLQKYVITYETLVADSYFDNPGTTSFSNTAWLSYQWKNYYGTGDYIYDYSFPGITKGQNTPTNIIEKHGVYDPAKHEITWTVYVNKYNVNINNGTIIDDLAGIGQTYVPGSFKHDCPSPGLITIVDADAVSTNKLTITVGAINSIHDFEFKTTVDDPADYAYNTGNKTYTNNVLFRYYVVGDLGTELVKTATGGVYVHSNVLVKKGIGYDINTNKVTWEVTVNTNEMPMANVFLTETIPAGQSFVEGSVKVGGTPFTGTVTHAAGDLSIDLGTINTKNVVTYETLLDVDAITDFKSLKSFTVPNSVTLERGGGYTDVTASGTQTITNNMLTKTGTLIDGNNAIKYEVKINPNGLDMTGLTLTDVFTGNMVLDLDSVKLYEATVTSAGVITKTATEVTVNVQYNPATKMFTLDMPPGSGRYVLEYECFITDNSGGQDFKNNISFDAVITSAAGTSGEKTVTVSSSAGGSGSSGKKARLDITKVNSEKQGIKIAGVEFELYAEMAGTRTLVATATTDASGKASFVGLTKTREYWLEEVGSATGYKADSAMVIEGSNPAVPLDGYLFTPAANLAITITNDPEAAGISLLKINDANQPLEGVEFVITDKTVANGFVARTEVSDEDGKVTFADVPVGVYKLVETVTIANHILNSEEYTLTVLADGTYTIVDSSSVSILDADGVNVIVNESEKGNLITTIYNKTTMAPMAFASFRLVDDWGNDFGTAISDANGQVKFTGLPLGARYMIYEDNQSSLFEPSAAMQITLNSAAMTPDPDNPGELVMEVPWPKTPQSTTSPGAGGGGGYPNNYPTPGGSTPAPQPTGIAPTGVPTTVPTAVPTTAPEQPDNIISTPVSEPVEDNTNDDNTNDGGIIVPGTPDSGNGNNGGTPAIDDGDDLSGGNGSGNSQGQGGNDSKDDLSGGSGSGNSKGNSSPQTGDSSQLMLWIILFAVSLVTSGIAFIIRKKMADCEQ